MKNERLSQRRSDLSTLEVIGTTSFSSPSKYSNHETKDIKLKIIRFIRKRFKNPQNAFTQIDYKGQGFITKSNFYAALLDIKNAIPEQQIQNFFRVERIFQADQKINFAKFMAAEEDRDETESMMQTDYSKNNFKSALGSLVASSIYQSTSSFSNRQSLEQRLQQVEDLLKNKILCNYSTARRAFLELDRNFDGLIEAEDLSLRLVNSVSLAQGDLKMLFRMKSSRSDGKLTFADFIKWFGSVIDPPSDFYFRHDDKRIVKKASQTAHGDKGLTMSLQDMEKRLRDIFHQQWKSVNKAFMDLKKEDQHYVDKEDFKRFLEVRCGFNITETQYEEFFNKIDADSDGRLTYPEFNQYFGFDISPAQDLFFRQEAPIPKHQTGQIIRHWEFNASKLNQGQIKQTQRINRGHQLIEGAVQQIGAKKWVHFIQKLQDKDKFGDKTVDRESFFDFIEQHVSLDSWDRECIQEALMSGQSDVRISINHLLNYKGGVSARNSYNEAKENQKQLEAIRDQFLEVLQQKGKSERQATSAINKVISQQYRKPNQVSEILVSEAQDKLLALSGEFALQVSSISFQKFRPYIRHMLERQIRKRAQLKKEKNSKKEEEIKQLLREATALQSQHGDLPKLRIHSRLSERQEDIISQAQSKTIDIPHRNSSPQTIPIMVSERRLRSSKSVGKFQQLPSMTASSFYPSQQLQNKKLKQLKTKLQYEWTNIYRTLLSRDLDQQDIVSSTDFKAALLRAGIYLDKESWRTIATHFATGDNIYYKEMSLTLGLHRQGLENMNSSRLSSFLSRLKLKRSPVSCNIINQQREPKLHPMHKSMSETQIRHTTFNTLGRNPSLLKRLFRNFDEQNNSQVTQHDFLNITNKMGIQLSSRVREVMIQDIEPFRVEEVIKDARKLKLNENSRKINYKKFLDRLEASRQGI